MNKELIELADKVLAGHHKASVNKEIYKALFGEDRLHAPYALYTMDLSEVKNLHYKVIPDWEWGLDWLNGDQIAYVRKGMVLIECPCKNPEEGWTAAILKAVATK